MPISWRLSSYVPPVPEIWILKWRFGDNQVIIDVEPLTECCRGSFRLAIANGNQILDPQVSVVARERRLAIVFGGGRVSARFHPLAELDWFDEKIDETRKGN